MIPRLEPVRPVADDYLAFIDALPAAGWRGEVALDEARRTVAATDNSVYQIWPQAVLYPRSRADVIAALTLLDQPRFRSIRLTPRGGGTGTNGQALTDGLVLDVSRHLHHILAVDLRAGTVRVEPGVVLDQLNDHLRPHGVFFAPELSPSNRATLGGMISTDAAGKGSRVYGKTSEHVRGLTTVLLGGAVVESAPIDDESLATLCARTDRIGGIHRVLDEIAATRGDSIAATFPKLRRFMTGYDLAHIRGEDGRFDLNAILCGSEGTLGVLVEATLQLTPIPTHARLVVLGYAHFDDALGSAEALVERRPAAIETIDQMVLDLARGDAIWPRVEGLLGAVDSSRLRAINLVEFTGTDAVEVEVSVAALVAWVEAGQGSQVAGSDDASSHAPISHRSVMQLRGCLPRSMPCGRCARRAWACSATRRARASRCRLSKTRWCPRRTCAPTSPSFARCSTPKGCGMACLVISTSAACMCGRRSISRIPRTRRGCIASAIGSVIWCNATAA
jgi:FAD/FMN-containing dehydrogenase